jgi:hypothetical protein
MRLCFKCLLQGYVPKLPPFRLISCIETSTIEASILVLLLFITGIKQANSSMPKIKLQLKISSFIETCAWLEDCSKLNLIVTKCKKKF